MTKSEFDKLVLRNLYKSLIKGILKGILDLPQKTLLCLKRSICKHEWKYYPAAFFKDMAKYYQLKLADELDIKQDGLWLCKKCQSAKRKE